MSKQCVTHHMCDCMQEKLHETQDKLIAKAEEAKRFECERDVLKGYLETKNAECLRHIEKVKTLRTALQEARDGLEFGKSLTKCFCDAWKKLSKDDDYCCANCKFEVKARAALAKIDEVLK